MKAFIVDRYKSKDVGRIGEIPEPEVRENDVLVEVHAAGVYQLDSKIADGEFKLILPYKTPFVLGQFIPFHASKRKTVKRDHFADRFRHHTSSCGQGLSIRIG